MPTGEPAGPSLNVGLFARAIKGKLIHRPVMGGEATQSGNNRAEDRYFLKSSSAALRWAEAAARWASTRAISALSVSMRACNSSCERGPRSCFTTCVRGSCGLLEKKSSSSMSGIVDPRELDVNNAASGSRGPDE